jgi:hypothetical protein
VTPDERITELEESTQELALSISRTLDVLAQCCRKWIKNPRRRT